MTSLPQDSMSNLHMSVKKEKPLKLAKDHNLPDQMIRLVLEPIPSQKQIFLDLPKVPLVEKP
jgi:hypothetical protein